MEVLIEITEGYDKDLKKLSQVEKNRIRKRINELISVVKTDKRPTQLYRTKKIVLPDGLESSLYFYRIDEKLRIVLSYDNDPIFNRKILTLYRVTSVNNLDTVLNSILDIIYHSINQRRPLYGTDKETN